MTDLFAALKPCVVNAHVKIPAYGREFDFRLGTLSWAEWQQFDALLSYPAVPQTLAGPNNTKLPNYSDRHYKSQYEAVDEEKNYRRLALAMSKAGHDLTDFGATVETQTKALRDLDAGVATALINFLRNAAGGGNVSATTAVKADE